MVIVLPQILGIELYEISQDQSPPIFHNVFNFKKESQSNLSQISHFSRSLAKSAYYITEIIS